MSESNSDRIILGTIYGTQNGSMQLKGKVSFFWSKLTFGHLGINIDKTLILKKLPSL